MVILYILSYDNFSPADRKHTKYRLNPTYYWFTLKGLGLGGYARRNYMVPVPEAETLEKLNEDLLDQCLLSGSHHTAGSEKSVDELYEQEKQHLLASPQLPFSNLDVCSGKVNKYSTVICDKNRYSVLTRYFGLKIRLVLYVDRIDIFSWRSQDYISSTAVWQQQMAIESSPLFRADITTSIFV